MRREWIEIVIAYSKSYSSNKSPSMRREWIEMVKVSSMASRISVSLHAEGVD